MRIARNRAELDEALDALRQGGARVALVPTMGALHDGHLGLVHIASERAEVTAASIFVNPTQFGPNEDFAAYPRTEDADLAALEAAGCGLAYLSDASEMYPPGDDTRVVPGALAQPLDGAARPGHFTGVCTVVAKLFAHVRPDAAVFGEKDYQQLLVIRRMTRDLGLGTQVVGAPIARAADGLALSSRNRYLSDEERERASALPAVLAKVAGRIRGGVAADTAVAQGASDLAAVGLTPDYLEARSSEDLSPAPPRPLRRAEAEAMRLFAAVRVGSTRLIDNLPVTAAPASGV